MLYLKTCPLRRYGRRDGSYTNASVCLLSVLVVTLIILGNTRMFITIVGQGLKNFLLKKKGFRLYKPNKE